MHQGPLCQRKFRYPQIEKEMLSIVFGMEFIATSFIIKFYPRVNLVSDPPLSIEVAVTNFTDFVLGNMDKGCVTGAVFLDLSKAFDTIDHDSLLQKLTKVGFSSSVIDWFQSYLSDRTQVTCVGNSTSSA